MIRVEGNISDFFGNRRNTYLKISKEKQRQLALTMIDKPITKDDKPIGFIKAVRVDEDKWIGYIFENGTLETDVDLNNCYAINLE